MGSNRGNGVWVLLVPPEPRGDLGSRRSGRHPACSKRSETQSCNRNTLGVRGRSTRAYIVSFSRAPRYLIVPFVPSVLMLNPQR